MRIHFESPLRHSVMALTAVGVLFLSSCSNDSETAGNNATKQSSEMHVIDSVVSAAAAKAKDTSRRYEVQSGIVHYKPMTMSPGVTVDQTIYFDNYGKREIRESRTTAIVSGTKTTEHAISILDGDYTYSYVKEKTVNGKDVTPREVQKVKLSNEAKTMLYLFGSGLASEVLKQYDYKEEGTETVAGFVGKKQSLAPDKTNKSVRIYAVTYKNIPLKTDMPDFHIVAETFEENASIDADLFQLPSDYKVIDVSPKQ